MARSVVRAFGVAALAGLILSGSPGSCAGEPAPSLEARLSRAPVVVSGRAVRVQPFDDDRVRVIHFAIDRIVKGEERLASSRTVEIVEMRDRPAAPDLLSEGDGAVVFLRPSGGGSYLHQTLGAGRRWQAVDGSRGVVADEDPAVVREAAELVDRIAARSRTPAETREEYESSRRAWTFDAIAAAHPALVAEGASALPDLPDLAPALADEERVRLEAAVRRDDLPARVRAELIDAIAEAKLAALAPVLASLSSDDPRVLDASWRAQASLGAPPPPAAFERGLRDGSPGVRAAAARRYVATWPDAAIPSVAGLLRSDDDADARIAALEALGPVAGDEAREAVETAFVEDDELEVRQAAGRVLFERGDEQAAESLGRLAFRAAPPGQRHAVALLLALERPDEDPILERIRDTHPDPEVRELAKHGISVEHH